MLVEHDGVHRAILRAVNDFGFESYDLLSPPRRLFPPSATVPLLLPSVDKRRVKPIKTPAELLNSFPKDDTWLSITGRSLARLYAAFLIAEDPQRRLDAHKAASLMHQVSLVQHILSQPNLRKVLIGDEVGLGKTIEAGLLIRRLIDQNPGLRVLYLAPARLVSNVTRELREKLDLDARQWIAGGAADARLESDHLVVASIHKAVFGENFDRVVQSGPWDVLIVDECHHLSDWGPTGGKPNQAFRLVSQLVNEQPTDGRLILMSGTPHQGSEARFKNLLRLLSDDGKTPEGAIGRVIFRTKDRVRDWKNQPLFPSREVRQPTIVQLGSDYERWYAGIAELYDRPSETGARKRAAAWAKGQALQWAASSVQAGLGFLVRLAMRRLGWNLKNDRLAQAIAALRPYRGGPAIEPLEILYLRLQKQIGMQLDGNDLVSDAEEDEEEDWIPNPDLLGALLSEAVHLLATEAAVKKWEALSRIIDAADGEKIVLFAQPVETVGVVAAFLEKRYGVKPAIIVGNQSDEDRTQQVRHFQTDNGPRFLVSSRAGGEGLNMQRARRLIHLDVPWNPMELEQRVGRVHRFGSRRTIIVDTVVAAGSREVDMYRIARDKLALIVSQLDPEQFEILFSRVMSLVPPKELEEVIGNGAPGPWSFEESAEIGRLVTEGFRSWKSFDETYRHEAERIRSVDPGNASWADVGNFLIKYASAEPADNVIVSNFEFREDEIVAIDEPVPALHLGGKTYACGDTTGLQPETHNGEKVAVLGLNLDEIAASLRAAFLPNQAVGVGAVRRFKALEGLLPTETIGLLILLRQSILHEGGTSNELCLTFHMFALGADMTTSELESLQRAQVARLLLQAQRVKEPALGSHVGAVKEIETALINQLRRPTEEEIALGVRHTVWPIAFLHLEASS